MAAQDPRYGCGMATGEMSEAAVASAVEAAGEDRLTEEPAKRVRLLFASFLMLFTELALIRWITANNVFVTEATNLVLLASFLGIGIGFLNARTGRDYLRWTPRSGSRSRSPGSWPAGRSS